MGLRAIMTTANSQGGVEGYTPDMADSGSQIITTLQAWLAGLIGLGALYIIAANPTSIVNVLKAGQQFISGTEGTVIRA